MSAAIEPRDSTAILVGKLPDRLAGLSRILEHSQIAVRVAPDAASAFAMAGRERPDYFFVFDDAPDSGGQSMVKKLKKRFPLSMVALVVPRASVEARRRAIAEGADDYIEADESQAERLEASVQQLLARKQMGILGRSERILQIIEIVRSIAPTKVTVLITGESGTGKELIARAIHLRSARSKGPFIAVNCGALPQGVLESELFGHEKGSFTGATSQRKGRFELADGGSLLLDEVGEMPLGTQVKLLRVLEEERFLRVGGSQDVKVDVRVIASTNKDLRLLVERGEFRTDLFYRLNVIPIHMPALRERRDDIAVIFRGLVEQTCQRNSLTYGGITDEAMRALEAYDWPGNVRELRNLAESMLVLAGGKRIGLEDLPEHVAGITASSKDLPVLVARPRSEVERDLLLKRLGDIDTRVAYLAGIVSELRDTLLGRTYPGGRPLPIMPISVSPVGAPAVAGQGDRAYGEAGDDSADITVRAGTGIREVERELIEKTLRQVGGNRKRAAQLLGIGERTLYRRMKQYNLR